MFFEPGPPPELLSTVQQLLSYIAPKNADDVKLVAAALKTHGDALYETFLEWASTFGRYKAKLLWAKARPDPDALEEVVERQRQAANERNRFQLHTAAEIRSMPIPKSRIKGLMPDQGIVGLYGASGSAKSFLGIHASASIGEGTSFFGHAVNAAPVLYVALEGEAGIRGRMLAWEQHHKRSMPDAVRFLFQPFRLTNPQDVIVLAAMCPPNPVIFIDTLNRAAPGADENSSKDMGHIIEGAKTLQRLTGGLVVLIAHTGKDANKGLRGHSSLIAALDAAIYVERSGDARTWRLEKSKDGRDGIEHAFRLETVEIGLDEDGDELTSAVIVADETRPVKSNKPLTGQRQIGMASFHEAASKHGVLAENGSFAGVSIEAWREYFYRAHEGENDDAKRKAFGRARASLIEEGHVVAAAGDLYLIGGATASAGNAIIAASLLGQREMSRTTA